MQLAREGYPLIGGAAAITLVAWLFGAGWLALVALTATLFLVNFFRDPDRTTPPGDHLVTAPADGRVVSVAEKITEDKFIHGECRRVCIFMSPLDVHVNRAPVDGTVVHVQHRSGRFHAAYLDKSSEFNEQTALLLEDTRGSRVLCVQIAGQLARRIICRVRSGDRVRRGERYGMITFGSRLDLYLPLSVQLSVNVGDHVTAGVTILGAYE